MSLATLGVIVLWITVPPVLFIFGVGIAYHLHVQKLHRR